MPPRYAYWTILIDNQGTAFRAREREELLPTLTQLRRTNKDVVLMWFARGRIWASREAEIAARHKPREKRTQDWRPGGTHEDPRKRFQKRGARHNRPAKTSARASFEKPTNSAHAAQHRRSQTGDARSWRDRRGEKKRGGQE
jgi:hypothetical protein